MAAERKTFRYTSPDGNPRSVKVVEFTSRSVLAVLGPRAQLEFACSRVELGSVLVYSSIRYNGDSNTVQVYIGEDELSRTLEAATTDRGWRLKIEDNDSLGFTKDCIFHRQGNGAAKRRKPSVHWITSRT